MNTQPQIPYWKRVVEQKSYRNNLDCRDLDALVSMLPQALLKLKFDEVEPEAFSLPEEYTTEDIEKAVNKVVIYLGLNKVDRSTKGHKHRYPLNVERRTRVTFKRFTPEEKDEAVAYIFDRKREFIDIYFDLDRIEKREFAPSTVMEIVIHEVCHEILWTYGYVETKGYLNLSPTQVTEYLTEICIVYTGFGKIMSNSSRHAEQRGLSDPGYIDWWQVSYLRQKFFNAPVPLRHTGLVSWLELDDLIAKCQWLKNLYGGSKVVAFRLLYIFIFLYVNKHSEGLNTNPTIEKVLACIGLCMFFPWKIKPMFGCLTPFLVLFGLVHLFGTTSGVLLGTSWYWPTLVSVCLIFLLLLWKMKSKLGYCGIFIYLSLFSFLFGSKPYYSNGILSDTSLKFPILVVFCICGYFIFRSKNEDKS